MAFMPRPPPVTFTMTCGTRRTTVASMPRREGAELRLRLRLDDAVAGVEEALAPRDQHAVDVMRFGHAALLHVARLCGAAALAWRAGLSCASAPAARRRCTRTSSPS